VNARKIAVLSAGLIAASACGSGQTAAKASAVSLVSGNGQTAKAGAPLPASLVVKVTDSSGAPIAGFPIAWSSTSGAVGAPVSQTASDGTASATATLGPAPGTQSFVATAAGLTGSPVTFTATAATALSCPAAPSCAPPVVVASPTPACGILNPCPTSRPVTCAKPVIPGPAVVAHHAVHPVNDPVSIDVPAGTASLTIVEQAISAPDSITINGTITIPNVAVPDKLRDPLGTLIYDDNPPSPPPADPSGELVFFASSSPVTSAFTIPNTTPMLQRTAQGLSPGIWQFRVNDFAFECLGASNCAGGSNASRYDVTVLLKPSASAASGSLDVAFYLVGPALLARDAPSDPGVKRMIATLAGIYASAGICLRNVTFYDVPSWAETAFGVMNADDASPCGDLDQMFRLSVPGNKLDFFLVGSLVATSQGGATVVGIDGTIPGPSGFGGTIHSGAAVNAADLPSVAGCTGPLDVVHCGPDRVAYIAAHEGGHWLGLYHTTELAGEDFDPLADTAKCPCETCAPVTQRANCNNSDPSLTTPMDGASCTASTACGGGDDLMFWVLGAESLGTLSCEQSAVMRANPAVQ